MTAPPGHTRELEYCQWFGKPKSLPKTSTRIYTADSRSVPSELPVLPVLTRDRLTPKQLTPPLKTVRADIGLVGIQERSGHITPTDLKVRGAEEHGLSASFEAPVRSGKTRQRRGGSTSASQRARHKLDARDSAGRGGGRRLPEQPTGAEGERRVPHLRHPRETARAAQGPHTRVYAHIGRKNKDEPLQCAAWCAKQRRAAKAITYVIRCTRDAQGAARSKFRSEPRAAVECGTSCAVGGTPTMWDTRARLSSCSGLHGNNLAVVLGGFSSVGSKGAAHRNPRLSVKLPTMPTYLSVLGVSLNVGKEIDFLENTDPQNRLNQ
ncbi:hypothetical protein EDB87DRAFT_1577426 [Lactarius vividus]|nr:hypothetical protein EDB87DRAFT_1577426 [Lactarius vividus]